MADPDDGYYRVSLEGTRSQPFVCGRYFKLVVSLIGGFCLLLFCFITNSVLYSSNTADPISLFAFTRAQSGVPVSRPNLLHQPRAFRVTTKAKKAKAAVAPARETKKDTSVPVTSNVAVPAGEIVEPSGATSGSQFEFSPPAALKTLQKIIGGGPEPRFVVPGIVIYDFQDPEFANPLGVTWAPYDFDVSTGEWSGTVGYAGVKTNAFEPPLDVYRCAGIKITVKGQGQRMKFAIRDNKKANGVLWSSSFDTNALFDTEVKIPFFDLKPTKFDRVVKDAPIIDLSSITMLQLTYSKFDYEGELNPNFKTGDFRILIKEIATY